MNKEKLKITREKSVEIWLPTIQKSWFGLWKVVKWEHIAITGKFNICLDGKRVGRL